MEENNNNENQVVKQVKDTAKNEAKNFGKNALKKFFKVAWPFIAKLIIILLVLGLINVVFYKIRSFFTGLFGSDDPDEYSAQIGNSNSGEEEESIVQIDENGRYKLKKDYAKEILEKLENEHVSTTAMEFKDKDDEKDEKDEDDEDDEDIEELKDMIDKYIETAYATLLPDNGKMWNDVKGKIKIKRTLQDGYLKFMEYNEFKKKFDNGNGESLLSYFTLTSDFKLCIVVEKSSNTYKDYNGDVISEMCDGGGYEIQEVDYQKYIEAYATPLNFFISLHLIAQNKNFMNDVVDMVKRKDVDDPIVFTFVESETTTTETIEYSGGQQINYVEFKRNIDNNYEWMTGNSGFSTYKSNVINNTNISEYMVPNPSYAKMIVKTHSGSWQVTKADTWMINVEKEIVENPVPNSGGTDTESYIVTPNGEWLTDSPGPIGNKTKDENIETFERYYIARCDIVKTTTTEVTGKRYSATNETKKMKVDDFVEFIQEKYKDVENNLTTAPSNLFYFLQQSESTQRQEKIMRYVIYKLSGIDYGITDLSELDYLFGTKYYTGGIVVKTDFSGSPQVLTREQIQNVIELNYEDKRKENLLSALDSLVEIQKTYKVNAVFAIAVFEIESGCGTGWDAIAEWTYNWASITGSYNGNSYSSSDGRAWRVYSSYGEATMDFADLIANSIYYFKAGKYTISEIGPTYCNATWATNVSQRVIQLYESIGIKITSLTSNDLLKQYIRTWEGKPKMNANETKYVIFDDGFENPTVGYGVLVSNYKQLFINSGYGTAIGDEVDIAFVDQLEEKEINIKLESVKSYTSGLELTGYQINALVSRAYNMGVAGALENMYTSLNFVDAYKAYWNQDKDDKFGKKVKSGDYSHKLYTEYMKYVIYSNGQIAPGLVNRRKSEWTLFQTGYYDNLDTWHMSGEANEIQLRIAEIAQSYMGTVYPNRSLQCLGWTNLVYEEAGLTPLYLYCCAKRCGHYMGVSTDPNSMPVGAWVYDGSYSAGHVGIYIGDGRIIHNTTVATNTWKVQECTVDTWWCRQNPCWGLPAIKENIFDEEYTVNTSLIGNCGGH